MTRQFVTLTLYWMIQVSERLFYNDLGSWIRGLIRTSPLVGRLEVANNQPLAGRVLPFVGRFHLLMELSLIQRRGTHSRPFRLCFIRPFLGLIRYNNWHLHPRPVRQELGSKTHQCATICIPQTMRRRNLS